MIKATLYIQETKDWIKNFVIGLELCPFAKQPYDEDRITYVVSEQIDPLMITGEILVASEQLSSNATVETQFTILPKVTADFEQFFDIVSQIQHIIDEYQTTGTVLVAFHPQFQYFGSNINNTTNATNRSPYPMIHLLKKESMDQASEGAVNIGHLLEQNKNLLGSMSWEEIKLKSQKR